MKKIVEMLSARQGEVLDNWTSFARENVQGLNVIPKEEVQLKARDILSGWLAGLRKPVKGKWRIEADSPLHEALIAMAEEWDKLEVPPMQWWNFSLSYVKSRC